MDADTRPQPCPVRKVGERDWEVLIANETTWLSCDKERDARIIARGPVLEYESLEDTRTGTAFAAELEELAATYERYRIFTGSRFFPRRANEARRNV